MTAAPDQMVPLEEMVLCSAVALPGEMPFPEMAHPELKADPGETVLLEDMILCSVRTLPGEMPFAETAHPRLEMMAHQERTVLSEAEAP